MKYVSHMLLGLSIAAVLAMTVACQQATDPKKSAGGSSSSATELNLAEDKILEALKADITTGVDFDKTPVEVNADLSISKKLKIGTEEDVAVAVAVTKADGGAVTGLNVNTTGEKISVTVPNKSDTEADNWKVTFTFTKGTKTKTHVLTVKNVKAAGGSSSPSTELNLAEDKILEALKADITTGVDFDKTPVEVNADLSISKKLKIGTEEDVAVAVAVTKADGGAVTGLNVNTTGEKISVTVPNKSDTEADNWKVTFTFTKGTKTKTHVLTVKNVKA
ncbi:MAG: hypothetical protein ACTTH8_07095 [Treponema sp.]